jgi:hypothetical protein
MATEAPVTFWEAWFNVITVVSVHDDPMPGSWLCGECPYSNVGSICTKCGAPRWRGVALNQSQQSESA